MVTTSKVGTSHQAHSQGSANGCNAPTRNLQNIKENKHADQPAKMYLHSHFMSNKPNVISSVLRNPLVADT
jgi:endonuclease IV